MKIIAQNIKKFDFLVGHGKVDDVRVFYTEQAVHDQVVSSNKKMELTGTGYARLIAEQQEQSYRNVPDRVVVTFGGKKKTFFANDEVEIYRVSKVA